MARPKKEETKNIPEYQEGQRVWVEFLGQKRVAEILVGPYKHDDYWAYDVRCISGLCIPYVSVYGESKYANIVEKF
jgi:hypothetical protein